MAVQSKEVVDLIQRLAVAIVDSGGARDTATDDVLKLDQQVERSELLDRLVEQVRPYTADPDRWISWAQGGPFPSELNMTRPVPSSQRASRAIGSATRDAARAQTKVDAAKLALSEAEAERDAAQAVNAAQTHFAIMHQLTAAMRGTFAMGPAWTLMRAVSNYDAQNTKSFAEMSQAQQRSHKAIREVRERDTARILASLDYWCGETDYEAALRLALMSVVKEFEAREEEREESGVKRRPLNVARTSMRQTSPEEVSAVIDMVCLGPKEPCPVPTNTDLSHVPF